MNKRAAKEKAALEPLFQFVDAAGSTAFVALSAPSRVCLPFGWFSRPGPEITLGIGLPGA